MRTYPHGVTCWIDTEQPDPAAAAEFYRGLFGWTLADGPPYLVASLDGLEAAGIGSTSADTATWNTYVAVDNLDTTADSVVNGGGAASAPVEDVRGARTAACLDPAGAAFRLWQPGDRAGAQVANAPGAWNFSDLHAPDQDAALAFYTPLFGWRVMGLGPGAGGMIQVPGYGDHLAATSDPDIHERQKSAPPGFADVIGGLVVAPGEPARWRVVFTVADRDASAATAEGLGATVLGSSEDRWTRKALVRDPQGAEFTVSQFTP